MKLRSLFASACALLVSGQLAVFAQTTTYDVSRDFSIAANPNGVWSYGWKSTLTGAFALLLSPRTVVFNTGVPVEWLELASGQQPVVYHNPTTNTGFAEGGLEVLPPGGVGFRAGFDGHPQNFGVIRFTVPAQGAGAYRLESAVRCYLDGTASKDADYHVVVNGVEVFGQFLAPNSGTGYTNTITLATGDTIDFMVGRGADGLMYGSGLKIAVSLHSPPSCSPHKATATAQLVNGIFVGATITDPGCGYTNAPMVLIEGGGGNGATATALMSGGQVTGLQVTSGGCCYTSEPKIVIGSPPFVPTVSIAVSKVKVTQNVVLGRKYVLESSPDFVTWTATGPAFVAESETIVNEFDTDLTGRFFQIREVP